MTDLPIIMSAPMVRALLREVEHPGTGKTMTRRLAWTIKTKNPHVMALGWELGPGNEIRRPSHWQRVQPGDRLWVRETWGRFFELDENDKPTSELMTYYAADGNPFDMWVDPDTGARRERPKWRSPFHCPRTASRLTLIVTATKIERLKDISDADVRAEGLKVVNQGGIVYGVFGERWTSPRNAFRLLWQSLHGPASWEANPEVVAPTFTVHGCNIDAMPERIAS